MRSASEIAERHGEIKSLLSPHEHPLFSDETNPGIWSDDTQLTLAVMKALVRSNGFDINAIAQAHVEAYTATPDRTDKPGKRGWGGSTVDSMERIIGGVSPLESGTIDGPGNGVLMKMAGLVLWQHIRKTPLLEMYDQYDQLTNMTHNGAIARVATRVHGDILSYLIREDYSQAGFMNVLEHSIGLHECNQSRRGEIQPGFFREQFEYLYEETIDRSLILAHTDGVGSRAPQTLAMSYGALIANKAEFMTSVYEAVNLGGDTDSTASIVAAMSVFATKARVELPEDYRSVDQLDMLSAASSEFTRAAFRQNI
jgi:ADP-ribosylglycohydrolase